MTEIRADRGRFMAVNNGAEKPNPVMFEVVGSILEDLTLLGEAAADLDDDEVSAAVWLTRQKLVQVGNLLARKRATA